ncbi:MAG: PEGA domain-containing protein [Myxococcaceae bacterium]|nr:PEGA domain-containing protein [Myxococcaceae bacterium]
MKVWPVVLGCACAARPAPQLFDQAGEGLAQSKARGGAVVLRCQPPDAEVSIDGVPVGQCSAVGERLPVWGAGWRHVEVKKPGFAPWETWIESGGARAVLSAELTRAPEQPKETP